MIEEAVVEEVVPQPAQLPLPDLGLQVVALVRERLKVEPQWCVSRERGFIWWPSGVAQRIYADPPSERDGCPVVLVHVETDVVREVPEGAETSQVLGVLNREATVAAFLWDHSTRKVTMHSAFAVTDTEPGVDALATTAAFVQVGELARQVNQIAASIPGSIVDESSHPTMGLRSTPSPEVIRLYRWCCDEGQKPSAFPKTNDLTGIWHWTRHPWLPGSACVPVAFPRTSFLCEFPFFSEMLARDAGDLGIQTTILRIDTTYLHPMLGAGALITLDLPFTPQPAHHIEQLQCEEAACPFAGYLMGAYSVHPNVVFRVFLPNVVAMEGVLDYFVWMMGARSHFVKGLLSPRQDILLEHTDVMDLVVTGLV